MQKAQLCVAGQRQGVSTQVGVSVTLTRSRTGEAAEVLIVLLGTLTPTVTDVGYVQTDSGATTAVEARARWMLAIILVLVTRAVIDTVTAYIQRQAEARP